MKLFTIVLLHELFNASGGVHQFLFTRIKRMTIRTDFNLHITHRSMGLKGVSTGTADRTQLIFRMNVFFHNSSPYLQKIEPTNIKDIKRNFKWELCIHGTQEIKVIFSFSHFFE